MHDNGAYVKLREQLVHTRLMPMLGALDQPIESMSSLELAYRIADVVMPLIEQRECEPDTIGLDGEWVEWLLGRGLD